MAFGINDFKSNLIGGGARPSLFNVSLNFPSTVSSASVTDENAITPTSEFLIKGASLPGSTVGTYDVFFHGKPLKIAGDRSFETWETTVINDEGFEIRNAMEEWIASMGSHSENKVAAGVAAGDFTSLYGTATVNQYGKEGSETPLQTYTFVNIFPVSMSEIALEWGTNDTIEEFTVEFAYDYWTHTDVVT